MAEPWFLHNVVPLHYIITALALYHESSLSGGTSYFMDKCLQSKILLCKSFLSCDSTVQTLPSSGAADDSCHGACS